MVCSSVTLKSVKRPRNAGENVLSSFQILLAAHLEQCRPLASIRPQGKKLVSCISRKLEPRYVYFNRKISRKNTHPVIIYNMVSSCAALRPSGYKFSLTAPAEAFFRTWRYRHLDRSDSEKDSSIHQSSDQIIRQEEKKERSRTTICRLIMDVRTGEPHPNRILLGTTFTELQPLVSLSVMITPFETRRVQPPPHPEYEGRLLYLSWRSANEHVEAFRLPLRPFRRIVKTHTLNIRVVKHEFFLLLV